MQSPLESHAIAIAGTGTEYDTEPHPSFDDVVASTVACLRDVIRDRIAPSPWAADAPASLTPLSGGKLVRARAFLAAALALAPDAATDSEYNSQRYLPTIAAALELVHTASLVHDDIVDQSVRRRGHPALHIATSEASAILVGDALFALAFEITAPFGSKVTAAIARAFSGLCEGQLLEPALNWSPGALPLIERYCSLKTGALFGASFELAGIVNGGDSEQLIALRAAGTSLGTAFQLVDDLLDLHGDTLELGKDNGADLRNGVPTFPLWFAFQRLDCVPSNARALEAPALIALSQSPEFDYITERTELRIVELVTEARGRLPATANPALMKHAISLVIAEPISKPKLHPSSGNPGF